MQGGKDSKQLKIIWTWQKEKHELQNWFLYVPLKQNLEVYEWRSVQIATELIFFCYVLSNSPSGWDQTILFPSEKMHGKKYSITIAPLFFIQENFIVSVTMPFPY